MDPQIAIAAISAMAAIVLGYFRLMVEVRETHRIVNSRMDELLELTRVASFARGKLDSDVGQGRLDPPDAVQDAI